MNKCKWSNGGQIHCLKLLYSPTDDLEVTNSSEDRNSPPNRVTDGDLSRKSSSHDQDPVGAVEHRESLLDALRQVLKHQLQHKLH